jgi:hypothetical protein
MSCLQTVEAMTDASEGALTGWKKVRYRVHITICPFCRAHRRQVEATIAPAPRPSAPFVENIRCNETVRPESLTP